MKFEGIPYEVIRRRVKYSRVEFKGGGLRVVVPRGINPRQVLEDNREVILKKHHNLMNQIKVAEALELKEWNKIQFADIVEKYVQKYSGTLKVETRLIKYRKMRRRWGSCRNDGVITLNIFLRFVPEQLIAYIIYHELAHLVVRGHNREFKSIISREFPNYKLLDKELNLYGLRLLS
jgi:predicted metal-dependent hydrolase